MGETRVFWVQQSSRSQQFAHEEADGRLVLHAAAAANEGCKAVMVRKHSQETFSQLGDEWDLSGELMDKEFLCLLLLCAPKTAQRRAISVAAATARAILQHEFRKRRQSIVNRYALKTSKWAAPLTPEDVNKHFEIPIEILRVDEGEAKMSMEQRRNAGAGSDLCRECSSLTTAPPRRLERAARGGSGHPCAAFPRGRESLPRATVPRARATAETRRGPCPLQTRAARSITSARCQSTSRRRGGAPSAGVHTLHKQGLQPTWSLFLAFDAEYRLTPYAYKGGKSCKETCITAKRDWEAMAFSFVSDAYVYSEIQSFGKTEHSTALVWSVCSFRNQLLGCTFNSALDVLIYEKNTLAMLIDYFQDIMLIGVKRRLESRRGEIPEKTRRPAASSGTISTCENPEATPPGIEPGLPRWEVSNLTTTPPRLLMLIGNTITEHSVTAKKWNFSSPLSGNIRRRCKLRREDGLGKDWAMAFVWDPFRHSPENHEKQNSGWANRESNPYPSECEYSDVIVTSYCKSQLMGIFLPLRDLISNRFVFSLINNQTGNTFLLVASFAGSLDDLISLKLTVSGDGRSVIPYRQYWYCLYSPGTESMPPKVLCAIDTKMISPSQSKPKEHFINQFVGRLYTSTVAGPAPAADGEGARVFGQWGSKPGSRAEGSRSVCLMACPKADNCPEFCGTVPQ
ncbi:hypothetical protein PR048_028963 [Dryococelus australis]|uniref:Uncharacterized protein n=1 Tax=Dryococelus australis TaxID=614101 RepID=A0ABQ9GEN5_9NEOP|nr:hypothetical protein PR048_028963 [Dryococelus australis]